MFKDIRQIASRAAPTLVADTIGATALLVMLVVGLHLSGLI
ncbi:MAG: hypothetical protein AAGF74_10780 [Pseudomonadota bacterium]